MKTLLAVCALIMGLFAARPVAAQVPDLDRRCLVGDDAGNGLDLVVDSTGDVHLSRVERLSGDWLHTRVGPDGVGHDTVIRARIGVLLTAEIDDTGIAVHGETVYACAVDRRLGQALVATGAQGVWQVDVLEGGVEGDGCDVDVVDGTPWVAWQSDGALKVARRAADGWVTEVADAPRDRAVGGRPALAVDPLGAMGVAHRDMDGALRLSARLGPGDWSSFDPPAPRDDAGFEPHLVFVAAGQGIVLHGVANDARNQETDPGLLRTDWAWPDAAETVALPDYGIGGSVGADVGARGLWVASRYFSRSALFGDDDGLVVLTGDPLSSTTVEQYGPADARHRLEWVRTAVDPFGLPVIAFLDDVAAFGGDPGGAPVCIRRPVDGDGDRLPDVVEVEEGTDPARADTDGDGRTDGEEVLVDGTDPTGGGCDDCCEAECCGDDCPPPSANVVPDGDMEAAEAWPREGAIACTKDAAAAFAGGLGLRCGPGGGGAKQAGIALEAGRYYRLRLRHRVVSGTLYAFIGTRTSGVFTGFDNTSLTASAGDWSTHYRVFRTPADLARPGIVLLSATDEAFIDDVAIEPLGEGDSLVPNGDVEDVTGAWVRYTATGCAADEGDAYNGVGALGCGPGKAGARLPKLPLDPDGLYRLRYAWRIDDAPLYGWFGYRGADGRFIEVRGAALRGYVPSDGWRLFERVVRAPAVDGARYELAYYADGDGRIDDLTLHALAADASIVADGGFDGPLIAGWSRYGATACTPTDDAFDGARAARCRGAEAGLRQPFMPARPGGLYRLEAAYAVDAGSLALQVGVQSSVGFDLFAGTALTAFATGGTWRRHAATLRVPAEPEGDVRLVLVASGDARVDAVSLVPLAADADRLGDGGFELGGAGWRRYGGAACAVVEGGADRGARRAVCGVGQGLQTSAPVEPGGRFSVTGRVSVTSGGLYVFAGVRADGVFTPVPGGSRFIGPTNGWTDYALDFDGLDPAPGDFRVIVYADGEASVDDFALRAVP